MNAVLSAVESAPYHYLPVEKLPAELRGEAEDLIRKGYLDLLGKRGRYPIRLVVTVNGSYLLNTFGER